jgi:hypothetical protein
MVFTFNAENLVGVCLQLIFEVDPGFGLVLYFSKHRDNSFQKPNIQSDGTVRGFTIFRHVPYQVHSCSKYF